MNLPYPPNEEPLTIVSRVINGSSSPNRTASYDFNMRGVLSECKYSVVTEGLALQTVKCVRNLGLIIQNIFCE